MSVFKNHPDGSLYVTLAICTASVDYLDTDGAKAIVPAISLFFILMLLKITGAGLLAAKMYRDKSFSAKQEKDQAASGAPQAVPLVATMGPAKLEPVLVKDPIATVPESAKTTP